MQTKKVLAVDDDLAILDLMRICFEMNGYEAVLASSEDECLQAMAQGPYLAVLLDINLGSTSGISLLKKLKQSSPDLPVIMVTGLYDENEARHAMECGALEYITKPINFSYLINVLSMQETKDDSSSNT